MTGRRLVLKVMFVAGRKDSDGLLGPKTQSGGQGGSQTKQRRRGGSEIQEKSKMSEFCSYNSGRDSSGRDSRGTVH